MSNQHHSVIMTVNIDFKIDLKTKLIVLWSTFRNRQYGVDYLILINKFGKLIPPLREGTYTYHKLVISNYIL